MECNCPITCNNDQLSCSGGSDERGCIKPDVCVQRGASQAENLCPGICPIQCEDNEIICKGVELQNGCITGDVCHAKAKNVIGEYCPLNSASHGCTIICKESETQCPVNEDRNNFGCMEEDICVEKTMDVDGNFCPPTSVCHLSCNINEQSCAGGMDEKGCKQPDVCHPM